MAGSDLPHVYDPAQVEAPIYRRWLEQGLFRARDEDGPRFSMVIPPPNVTGRLHMGHALDNAWQDVLVRWRRMQGLNVLWLPGTDHAGIATQAVVERRLAEEGTDRRALGRDRFLARVWAWKEEYEAGIQGQLQALGTSCDWSRMRFTMDEGLSRAVEEVFLRYYREGLIYRGDYIVNWCPRCGTAISDLEVDHVPEDGLLYRIRYPLQGGGELVVATVRPETMLGDTAVAVHPDDERYRAAVGRQVQLPLAGRLLPVVADGHVDPAFGTGALKVTPAHDPDDFALAERHGLPAIQVIGTDGRLTAEAGERYAGLEPAEARRRVLADLESAGLLAGSEPYQVAVARCSRCGGVVEPLISLQWFVRMKPLAAAAVAAVEDGSVRFLPDRFTRVFLSWMENVRDWCISRQLWWGHRIPAHECRNCGEAVAGREPPEVCPRCGGRDFKRDPDVLDTWFSSALWPFSTLGWPADSADLRRFYPTDVLVTGYDILFFWVARMLVSGLHFTGEVPFRTVVLHGLVRDAEGRKMSKSLGNGIDPLEVVQRFGADALRLTLLTGVTPGGDTRFSWEKVEGSQRFCNKLWNAARFVLLSLDGQPGDGDGGTPGADGAGPGPAQQAGAMADRWIRSRCRLAAAQATLALERFDPGEALRVLYAFTWGELCDWYIEAVKPRLYGRLGEPARLEARRTLVEVMETTLRLLHPFAPFLTEALWQALPHQGPSIMVAPWPAGGPPDADAERVFGLGVEVTGAIRSLRAEFRVPPAAVVRVRLAADAASRSALESVAPVVCDLARVEDLSFGPGAPGERAVSTVLPGGVEVVLPLGGLVDVQREVERLRAALAGAEQEMGRVRARLANPGFLGKAKPEVVAREREREGELGASIQRLAGRLAQIDGA